MSTFDSTGQAGQLELCEIRMLPTNVDPTTVDLDAFRLEEAAQVRFEDKSKISR